jgi:hypothetical protein
MWSRLPTANACIRRTKDALFNANRAARSAGLLGVWCVICVAGWGRTPAWGQASDERPTSGEFRQQGNRLTVVDGEKSRPIPASRSPHEVGLQILHRTLHEAVWGQPVVCDVRQTSRIFDRKMTGFGKYVRGGQGSGQMRFSMQLPAGNKMNSLLQVSDGELVYTNQSIGSTPQRTRIDLGKVRDRLVINSESLNDPVTAMYLAVGGQAEVLRNLCQQYTWTQVKQGSLEQVDVWWVSGQRDLNAAGPTASAEIDQRGREKNQSGLLPTHVRLAISRPSAPVPFWLYHLEQSRPAGSREGISPNANTGHVQVLTEWPNPVLIPQSELSADIFHSQSTNDPFAEETSMYLPPAQPNSAYQSFSAQGAESSSAVR